MTNGVLLYFVQIQHLWIYSNPFCHHFRLIQHFHSIFLSHSTLVLNIDDAFNTFQQFSTLFNSLDMLKNCTQKFIFVYFSDNM
jgi:hypothetical protein